jgi:hypothetical protein
MKVPWDTLVKIVPSKELGEDLSNTIIAYKFGLKFVRMNLVIYQRKLLVELSIFQQKMLHGLILKKYQIISEKL